MFDRDPESNTDSALIENYISVLANPYDNEDGYKAGQMLLSYPSIESYTISNFKDVSLLRADPCVFADGDFGNGRRI